MKKFLYIFLLISIPSCLAVLGHSEPAIMVAVFLSPFVFALSCVKDDVCSNRVVIEKKSV